MHLWQPHTQTPTAKFPTLVPFFLLCWQSKASVWPFSHYTCAQCKCTQKHTQTQNLWTNSPEVAKWEIKTLPTHSHCTVTVSWARDPHHPFTAIAFEAWSRRFSYSTTQIQIPRGRPVWNRSAPYTSWDSAIPTYSLYTELRWPGDWNWEPDLLLSYVVIVSSDPAGQNRASLDI